MNIYKKILKQNIPKLLNLYNLDKFSSTYGVGDREYWGWKTKDFANATMQGGVHSLAIAIKLDLFEKKEKVKILELIEVIISATKNIIYPNGSVEEAYPQENSFCVTALVAFDLLSALYYLQDEIEIEKYFGVIKPLINFITKNDEEHAIISNHLATGVAAITLWNHLTGDSNLRYKELLEIIYKHQSSEGWYREYEGADPGYQTLCTYYLFCNFLLTKDEVLLDSLKRSAKFLKHFIHPDGTIGGLYGSRNTEVFYPAGIVGLSNEIEDFALIAKWLEPKDQQILPQMIDIGNFIPLLNSYAVAAMYYEKNKSYIDSCDLHLFWTESKSIDFSKSGIFLYSNKNYFSIINYKKGGTIKAFDLSSKEVFEDGGVFGKLDNNKKFTTQMFDENIDFKNHTIISNFYLVNEDYPTSFKFIILRLLSLTIFKSLYLSNLFKKIVVKKLMTGKVQIDGQIVRKFIFGDTKIIVEEKIIKPNATKWIGHIGKSRAIHMASSGYFNKQFFYQNHNLVEFKEVH
ncbi:MAG TPA: hypothetical protein EYG93_07490 [Sulfurospirillum arcachonense]|nr:hypothetical protein [Sulfurospirillum arcachonense]